MKGVKYAPFPFSQLAAGIALAALIPTPAVAQQGCVERDKALTRLETKFAESPISMGVTDGGGLIEVLATDDGKTWTIIVTTPQGMSCLVAAGEDWRTQDYEQPMGPGA